MYKVGDTVRYGGVGVCTVQKICPIKDAALPGDYYVLSAVMRPGSVYYVPTQNPVLVARISPLVTLSQIEKMFEAVRKSHCEWVHDFRKRGEIFRKAILSPDREELLLLMQSVYRHQKELIKNGKHIHTTDDSFLHDAENILFGEIAFVTGEPLGAVCERFRKLLNQ